MCVAIVHVRMAEKAATREKHAGRGHERSPPQYHKARAVLYECIVCGLYMTVYVPALHGKRRVQAAPASLCLHPNANLSSA
eukprot:6187517-Pleurochrysis_carterae.AAC.4